MHRVHNSDNNASMVNNIVPLNISRYLKIGACMDDRSKVRGRLSGFVSFSNSEGVWKTTTLLAKFISWFYSNLMCTKAPDTEVSSYLSFSNH